MQRWNGFAKDNGDIKVTPGFEYRDMFDNADKTHYECIGSILHVGQSFKHFFFSFFSVRNSGHA